MICPNCSVSDVEEETAFYRLDLNWTGLWPIEALHSCEPCFLYLTNSTVCSSPLIFQKCDGRMQYHKASLGTLPTLKSTCSGGVCIRVRTCVFYPVLKTLPTCQSPYQWNQNVKQFQSPFYETYEGNRKRKIRWGKEEGRKEEKPTTAKCNFSVITLA